MSLALCAPGEHCVIASYRHPIDGVFFEKWFEDGLFAEIPKGYMVIMGNAQFHRKKELRKLFGGKVRLLFLPPYSPDYNPIKKSGADMKRFLGNTLKDFHAVASAIYKYFRFIQC